MGAVPEDVERFLVKHVPSVAHIEAILLMRREAERTFSVQQLAASLYVKERSAAVIIADLLEDGFVVGDGSGAVRYAPSPALASEVDSK